MKRFRFLHLGVNFHDIPGGMAVVDGYLNVYAPDWLRYSSSAWIIWTDLSIQELTNALKPALTKDQYLIFQIDASAGAQGLYTPFVWDWLNRPRDGNWVPPEPRPIVQQVPLLDYTGALGQALRNVKKD